MTSPATAVFGATAEHNSLASGLLEVHRSAARLTRSDRRRALVLYLAYRLRSEERASVPKLLAGLLAVFTDGTARGAQGERGRPADGEAGLTGGAWRTVEQLLTRYLGSDQPLPAPGMARIAEAERVLDQIGRQLAGLSGPDADPKGSWAAVLDKFGERAAAIDGVVLATAQEFFDRLLQALAPDAAREFAGKPGLRPALMYKAAVWDAYEEKFSQLAEYHQKGRLVRDFKASFKRNLRG